MIGWLRSLLFSLGQIIATIFFATIGLLLFACPYRVRYHFITQWSHFIIWWVKIICGIDYHVQGKEHLPKHNAIILCNHQSAWETLFLQVLLPAQSWVLKKELLAIPFFGWALRLLEPIAIDRRKANSIKQLLVQGKERLNQGRWVVIFPEGTRRGVGELGKYSKSGAILSKESGFPIIPMVHNAGLFWPRNAFRKKPGVIQVVIGKAISPAYFSVEEVHEQIQQWAKQALQNIID